VALAELDACEVIRQRLARWQDPRSDFGSRRDEAVPRQRLRESPRPIGDVLARGVDQRLVPLLHGGKALFREILDRAGSGDVRESMERGAGDVEIVVADRRLAPRRQHVPAGRTTGPHARGGHALDLDDASAGQRIQMAPDGGGGKAEHVAQLRRAHGSMLEHGAEDTVASSVLGLAGRAFPGHTSSRRLSCGHGIHNTIFT
jgi:hypothetical protein